MHVTGQSEAVFEVCFGLIVLDLPCIDLRVEEREPACDAVLFFFEEVQRDGSGVVGVEQAAAFVTEPVALDGVGVPFCFVRGVEVIELAHEHVPQRGDDVLGYLHAPVVVLDLSFDVLDRHGLADTVRALGVPACADEVWVDDAFAVFRVGDHQTGAAIAAVHRAFQVVLVGLRLLPGHLVRGEDVLHPVPELRAHQRFVESVVAGATEDHVALVVRVGEHLLDRGQSRSLRRPFRGRHGREATVDKFSVQHRGRVVPRRVRLERPPHQSSAVGVRDHGGDVAPEFVALVDVEVADGGATDGAADGGFLGHALGDLVGEVAGVELRDRGHDAVQQHP
nr:hypothetical protein [Gulosibacter chungangensis]